MYFDMEGRIWRMIGRRRGNRGRVVGGKAGYWGGSEDRLHKVFRPWYCIRSLGHGKDFAFYSQ